MRPDRRKPNVITVHFNDGREAEFADGVSITGVSDPASPLSYDTNQQWLRIVNEDGKPVGLVNGNTVSHVEIGTEALAAS